MSHVYQLVVQKLDDIFSQTRLWFKTFVESKVFRVQIGNGEVFVVHMSVVDVGRNPFISIVPKHFSFINERLYRHHLLVSMGYSQAFFSILSGGELVLHLKMWDWGFELELLLVSHLSSQPGG